MPARRRAAAGENLHPFAGFEGVSERHHAAVDLGAAAAIADLRVDGVGEIQRR